MNLEDIEEIVVSAGQDAIRSHGRVLGERKRTSNVGDTDFQAEKSAFSELDAKLQKDIMNKVLKLNPKIGVIAEEPDDMGEKFSHVNKFVEGKYTLIIDPIDGTANYLSAHPNDPENGKRNPDFWGVSVAVAKGSEIILGVISYPSLNLVLKTEKGKGLFINGEKISLANSRFSAKDPIRVSGAMKDGELIRKHFRKQKSPGAFVVTLLGLFKASSNFAAEVPEYKAYIGKNISAYDIGCGPLAWTEAGGVICGIDGRQMNPLKYWRLDEERNTVVNDKVFIMAPDNGYVKSLISHIRSLNAKFF